MNKNKSQFFFFVVEIFPVEVGIYQTQFGINPPCTRINPIVLFFGGTSPTHVGIYQTQVGINTAEIRMNPNFFFFGFIQHKLGFVQSKRGFFLCDSATKFGICPTKSRHPFYRTVTKNISYKASTDEKHPIFSLRDIFVPL